jgi:hypothetical protein
MQFQQGFKRGLLARIKRADKDRSVGWKFSLGDEVALVGPVRYKGQII